MFWLVFQTGVLFAQEAPFPPAKQVNCVDTFFNTYTVQDPYRWLESTGNEEVISWKQAEAKMSARYLSRASCKNAELKIDEYLNISYSYPIKKGNYYFKKMLSSDYSSSSLYYQYGINTSPKLLVDPDELSKKDKIVIGSYDVSKDSKWLAYQFSRNGSDWAEAKVVSLKTETAGSDHLVNLKFSNFAWKGEGFFYCTFSQTDQFGKTEGQKVFYHKIGDDQSKDSLIFSRKNKDLQFDFLTTSDERFFVLTETNEQAGTSSIYYIDFNAPTPHLTGLLTNLKYDLYILDNSGNDFIAVTTHKANNGSIVKINPANPYKWITIIPEDKQSMFTNVVPLKDKLIVTYYANSRPTLLLADYEGNELFKTEFAVGTSLSGFSGKPDDDEFLFNYGSYTIPPVVYKFNVKTYAMQLIQTTLVTFDFSKMEYKEMEYEGKDGVKIPMTMVYRKGMKRDGSNPTILNAYGGFGSVEQPSFDPGIVYFVEEGGIYAFANIRGGGDKGMSWANAGKGLNKQTSFDDFISAAEYLIKEGYTSAAKLASTGGSNGGLVVAAAAIQRPDLFKAVVPVVAPLDMIRFQKFTVGHWHTDEYGTIDDSLSFTKLLRYSPLHNIKEDVNYPAMLIMTSENDDRVPPFHSYKFAARLQNRKIQTNPVLLRIEKKAGHDGSSTSESYIKEAGDKFGFIMQILNDK